MRISLALLFAGLFCGAALAQQGAGTGPGAPPPASKAGDPPSTLARPCDPSFGGKYAELVRQIPIPEDEGQYGRCHDYGAWNGTEYKGHTNLPNGAYWTYSAPNWYIWSRQGAAKQ
jgi:hypothetical protein